MDWSSQCAAVIPCLNEQKTIKALVTAVRRQVASVIVVDDGSSDATGARAEKAGAQVLRHESSRGKGASLQTGWQHARERGFLWSLTLDGDGQHSPEDIPAFFRCAEQTSATLVIGNRMAQADQIPWLRRLVNRWMSYQLSKLTGRQLPDSQCGFRLINLDVWSVVPTSTSHFEIESEVLLAFILAGKTVEFVPIQVIYKTEQSKIHPLRDTIRWFRWWSQARKRFSA